MFQTDPFNTATIEGMLEAPGEKWHRFPPDVIPLYLADLDFPIAMEIKKALLNAVHDEDLFYNTDVEARKAMAEKITTKNGLKTTHEDIMITQGVNPCMWLAIRHACKEGDGVILTNPMYGPFSSAVRVTNTRPVHWPLQFEEGYRFDVEALKELITPRTKLLYVCNPHNPCGRVMTEEELKGIADMAVDNKLKVMVDELHEDIVYDGRKHITLATLNPEIEAQTMTAWGFSKIFGVAGLQMGFLCATNKEMIEDLRKQARGVMRGTSTLAKAAAPVMCSKALDWWRRDIVVHLEKIRGICEKRFEEIGGITYSKLEGTYLMFPKFDYGMTSDELRKYLLEEGKIGPSSGTGFGSNGEGHLRFCIATSEAIINEVLDRLENALHKLK
jgi:bifunctional pyridoxal-dependent enzyme with beta-cystathionase and maltose regulon repressor activities